MKSNLITLLILMLPIPVLAQSVEKLLTLDEVHQILYTETPAADKAELQAQIDDFNRRIAKSGRLPEMNLEAGASYQSDVTEFPFSAPGFEAPEFSRDRYNISLNVIQPIYDGGRTRSTIEKQLKSGELMRAGFKSELFRLKQQADQIYFTILILQKREESASLVLDDLNRQLSLVSSQAEHGLVLPGDEAQIRAEIIARKQELRQLKSDLLAGIETLGAILERKISEQTVFDSPDRSAWVAPDISGSRNRPDIERLNLRNDLLKTEKSFALANRLPVVSVYANPFYGRPGFNIFDDDLTFNWIVGVRATWSFKNSRNAGLQADAIEIETRKNSRDAEYLRGNQLASLHRLKTEIDLLEEQIEMDREITRLRKSITDEKRKQLAEGAITSAEYIRTLNAEERANIQLEIRKIERVEKITQYETEWGLQWN